MQKQFCGRWFVIRDDGFYLTHGADWSARKQFAGSWHPDLIPELLRILHAYEVKCFAVRSDSLRLPREGWFTKLRQQFAEDAA
jgi:hypothetical protein